MFDSGIYGSRTSSFIPGQVVGFLVGMHGEEPIDYGDVIEYLEELNPGMKFEAVWEKPGTIVVKVAD